MERFRGMKRGKSEEAVGTMVNLEYDKVKVKVRR